MQEPEQGELPRDPAQAVPGLDGVNVDPDDVALSIGETAGQSTVRTSVQAPLEVIVMAAHAAGRVKAVRGRRSPRPSMPGGPGMLGCQ